MTTDFDELMNLLQDASDVLVGAGVHAAHEREQVGRCVYCSCGVRVQGRMRQ